jgi:hypothetical protein
VRIEATLIVVLTVLFTIVGAAEFSIAGPDPAGSAAAQAHSPAD